MDLIGSIYIDTLPHRRFDCIEYSKYFNPNSILEIQHHGDL